MKEKHKGFAVITLLVMSVTFVVWAYHHFGVEPYGDMATAWALFWRCWAGLSLFMYSLEELI